MARGGKPVPTPSTASGDNDLELEDSNLTLPDINSIDTDKDLPTYTQGTLSL